MDHIMLNIRLLPNARCNQITGFIENTWNIKIAAPPVDGKANAELINYLSQVLRIGKSYIAIKQGKNSRCKLVVIEGLSQEAVIQRLSKEQNKL
jgi:uncharacterized protein (TIGR00251 family)